jgi:hypothetical protein
LAIFNAFQLVLLFACAPFIISYVERASFTGATPLFWVLIIAYLIGFGGLVGCVQDDLRP